MSILIKGMEMPVTCCHCPLMGYDPDIEWNDGGRETQGAYICVITHEFIDNTKREEHCPLIPISPHGRLIDADAVFKRLQKQAMSVWGNGNPRYQIVLEVMDAIRFAPTIIEAEEEEK